MKIDQTTEDREAQDSRTVIAIYDLDRTVTRLPTYTAYLVFAARRLCPYRLLAAPLVVLAMAAHGLRIIDRAQLKGVMWRLLLGKVSRSALDPVIAAFSARTLARNIRAGARASIDRDRASGARLVLATAAHEIYAAPIAQGLGFDAVIATQVADHALGHVEPMLAGNVYAANKLAAVQCWLDGQGLARGDVRMRFYSDSASDRPLFEWVDEPVAVNPSRRLARLARTRRWPIEDWGAPPA